MGKVNHLNDPPKYWKNQPILSWVIDDFEQFNNIVNNSSLDLDNELSNFKSDSFDDISKVLFQSPFSLNLGGETTKNKLIATDKPIGVFNFSLASNTLYPLSEFYSKKLDEEDPNRFISLNLLSGIVPNILVEFILIGGENKYFYKDDNGVEYPCEKRVKGQTAIDRKVPNAKLEYKSKTKKVFQTYKRKGGKVKYVEIYSLFYYSRLNNDLQFAIRHLPAMMVAEYLESIGIKTRIYMTRFVELFRNSVNLREFSLDNNIKLPMYDQKIVKTKRNNFTNQLLLQPIIAKEFQQEIHNPLAYLISCRSRQKLYRTLAENTIKQETTQGYVEVYGQPDHPEQKMYWEGFERYRNKYLKYVKEGIFKSKEVLPQAMIFFHDLSINRNLDSFIDGIGYDLGSNYVEEADRLLIPEVNLFFTWWMKTSANVIKHKINLVNSNELNKDLREIKTDIQNTLNDLDNIINNTQNDKFKVTFKETSRSVLRWLHINKITLASGNQVVDFEYYVNEIVEEMMTFADDEFFPTSDEEVEKRLEFKRTIFEELKKI